MFGDHSTDLSFGFIRDKDTGYKFSWQSTLINPILYWINTNICLIGVDLLFIAFDFRTGEILRQVSFDSFFMDIIIYKNDAYVISQLEILVINLESLVTVSTIYLPDCYDKMEFNNDEILVTCLDGTIVSVGGI